MTVIPADKADGDQMAVEHADHHNQLAAAVNTVRPTVDRLDTAVFDARRYLAVGDGVADDTAAIQAAVTAAAGAACYLPPAVGGYYKITAPIVVPDNTIVYGQWGGGFWQSAKTKIVKTNGDGNGDSIFVVGANCLIRGISFQGPDDIYYLSAAYPASTNNPSYGIVSGVTVNNSTRIEHCSFENFKAAGIGRATGFQFSVATVFACVFRRNLFGIDWAAYDSKVLDCKFQHNVHSGLRTANNYLQVVGNRFEWNKRYGCQFGSDANIGGATIVCVGNFFDRNGWSGVRLMQWHFTVTGNVFRRNGAGGDSVKGIVEGIVPSSVVPGGYPGAGVTPTYLAPATPYDKSHIQVYGGQHGVISGNQFSRDYDDSGSGGAFAPKYVYTGYASGNVVIEGNQDRIGWAGAAAGDIAYRDGPGSLTNFDPGTAGIWSVRQLSVAVPWDPASVPAAGQIVVGGVTVADAVVGDPVAVGFSRDLQGMQLTGYVSAANTVTVVLRNGTAGAIDLASGTLRVDVWSHG